MDREFPRGDTDVFKFRLKDKNKEELSLSDNDRLFLTAKKNAKSSEIIFQKTIGNGIELGEDGYYHVTIEPVDTENLNYGTYGYDIEIVTATGKVKTLIIGSITLTDEFTHPNDRR